MRILIGLSIIQTMLLAFFGMRLISLDARMDSVVDTSLDVLSTTSQIKNTPSATTAQSSTDGLTGAETRWIIQEEFANFTKQNPTTVGNYSAQAQPAQKPAGDKGVNSYALKADVQQELDYFIGRGDINATEMANLQIKIAKLPPSERGEMLSRLTQSLSSGQIDGRF